VLNLVAHRVHHCDVTCLPALEAAEIAVATDMPFSSVKYSEVRRTRIAAEGRGSFKALTQRKQVAVAEHFPAGVTGNEPRFSVILVLQTSSVCPQWHSSSLKQTTLLARPPTPA